MQENQQYSKKYRRRHIRKRANQLMVLFFVLKTVIIISIIIMGMTLYKEYKPRQVAVNFENFENYESYDSYEFDSYNSSEQQELIIPLENGFSDWFLSNENSEEVSIWKKSYGDSLLLQIRNKQGKALVTFSVKDGKSRYNNWQECKQKFPISTRDMTDIAFVAYAEVGGASQLNVQAQMGVVSNRVQDVEFPKTVRGVICQKNQYETKNAVINRKMKSNIPSEKEDLEKTFKFMMLFFADEKLDEIRNMPSDVVYAALDEHGRVWRVIKTTKYCRK